MRVERREDNVVVIDYGRNVGGVKYKFNEGSKIPSIERAPNTTINEVNKSTELSIAKNALKMYPSALEIKKDGIYNIETEEVVDDDRSLRTVFNFETERVSKTSLDNNIGESGVNPDVSFEEFSESESNNAKLEIATEARKLITSDFRF